MQNTKTSDQGVPPKPRKASAAEALELTKTVGAALLIALALRVVVFEPFTIPSDSMEPGLRTGDYIVISKFDYGWSRYSIPFNPPLWNGRILSPGEPRRGDVLVFKLPRDTSQNYVKRLVGLPGDRVQFRGGVIFVNGTQIAQTPAGLTHDPGAPDVTVEQKIEHRPDGRSYVTFDRGPGHEGDDTDVDIVPAGTYFMVGDNRDNSLDSRWPPAVDGVGFVPAENVVGQARFVLLSWRGASLWKPWTWGNIDLSRLFVPVR